MHLAISISLSQTLSSTHGIICTRALSNLSAKTYYDIHFCMIIMHIACSLAFLPFLFVFYCIYLH